MNDSEKKWYDNKILTHLLIVFIFPVGLFALWKSRTIAKWWKVTATVLIAIIFFPSLGSEEETTENMDEVAAKVLELTQFQLDSIAEVKRKVEIEQRKSSTISARQLFKEYEDNEVLADRNYKGKFFYVEGIIEDIGKDILDDIYVSLESNNPLFGVQCYIDNEDVAASLKKGNRITLYGRCDGKLGTVGMKDCRLVENYRDL